MKKNKKYMLCACDAYQEIIDLFQTKLLKCSQLNGECKSKVIDDIQSHWQKINKKLDEEEGLRIHEERASGSIDLLWSLN